MGQQLADNPISLDESRNHLKNLSINSFREWMAIHRPPYCLEQTCKKVCIILHLPPISSSSSSENYFRSLHRFFMYEGNQNDKIAQLVSVRSEDLSPEQIQYLKEYYEDEECSPRKLQGVSEAGNALCLWLRALYLSS